MTDTYENALTAADVIRSKLPLELQCPKVAIVCGSGLGGIVDELEPSPQVHLNYVDIPHFLKSTVAGHAGKLIAGFIGKTPVVLMAGRFHSYEGYDIKDTVFPIRVFAVLKVQYLIATNAAGGINEKYRIGDIMLLNDHINIPGLSGLNPLKGYNDERFGVRFVGISDAYDHDLRHGVYKAAEALNVSRPIHEGVYSFVSGPCYESRAEVRYLKSIGADAVGMSTVPEVLVARHSNLKVLAVSLITNEAVVDPIPSGRETLQKSLSQGKANHEEVMQAANEASKDIQAIVSQLVKSL